MDKKTYKAWMAKIAEGEKVSKKTFEELVEFAKAKKVKGITPEAMARMEQELARLQEGIASIQDTYGQDHLHLTVIKGYVGKLLGSARVVRYLAQNHPEFLGEFQTITEITPAEAADAE